MITLGTTAATSARKSRTQKRGIVYTTFFFCNAICQTISVTCTICCFWTVRVQTRLDLDHVLLGYKKISIIPCTSLAGLTPTLKRRVCFILIFPLGTDSWVDKAFPSCTLSCAPGTALMYMVACFTSPYTQAKNLRRNPSGKNQLTVITPKTISHGSLGKQMSNLTRIVTTLVKF